MNVRVVGRASVVMLAIVALGVAAATLDSGTVPDMEPVLIPASGDLTFASGEPSEGVGGGSTISHSIETASSVVACPSVLTDPRVLAGVAGSLLVAGAVLFRATSSVMYPVIVAGSPLAGVLVVCQSLLLSIRRLLSGIPLLHSPLVLFGGVLAVAAGVVIVGLVASDRSSTAIERPGEDEALAEVGRIAGRAADRIDGDADVTNEVYRAWAEMTDHLDVPNPDARSPGEFADAAVAAGMAEPDVETLTDLFREVRYGGLDPDERAATAVNALRNIQRSYGTEGAQ